MSNIFEQLAAKNRVENFFQTNGTIVQSGGVFGYLKSTDWKATFNANAADVNINALAAASPEMRGFANTLLAHEDLKEGFNEYIKGEGLEGVQALQSVLADAGATSNEQVTAFLQDDMKRGLVAQMLTNTGKDAKITPAHAQEFIKAGLDMPTDPSAPDYQEKLDRFLKASSHVGVDPASKVKNEIGNAALTMVKSIFMDGTDIHSSINNFKNTLQGMGINIAGFEPFLNIFAAVAGIVQPGPEARRVFNSTVDYGKHLVNSAQSIGTEITGAVERSYTDNAGGLAGQQHTEFINDGSVGPTIRNARAEMAATSEEASKRGFASATVTRGEGMDGIGERVDLAQTFGLKVQGYTADGRPNYVVPGQNIGMKTDDLLGQSVTQRGQTLSLGGAF